MTEPGGPATVEGILYQAAVTTMWLTRMLDERSGIEGVHAEPPFTTPSHVRHPSPAYVDDIRVDYEDGQTLYCQVKISAAAGTWTWKKMAAERDRHRRPRNVWQEFFYQYLSGTSDHLEFWTASGGEVALDMCAKARRYSHIASFRASLTKRGPGILES